MSHIQKTLKAPKGQYNSFGNFNYRNKEDIVNAVKPLLTDGAYVNDTDELVLIGNRFYVKTTASLNYLGESVSAVAFAREAESKKGMDDSQLTGACSSYSGKYAFSKLFAIDDTKDMDHESNHDSYQQTQQGQHYDPNYQY
jgi:hypothetical protein